MRFGRNFGQNQQRYQQRLDRGGSGERFLANHPQFARRQQNSIVAAPDRIPGEMGGPPPGMGTAPAPAPEMSIGPEPQAEPIMGRGGMNPSTGRYEMQQQRQPQVDSYRQGFQKMQGMGYQQRPDVDKSRAMQAAIAQAQRSAAPGDVAAQQAAQQAGQMAADPGMVANGMAQKMTAPRPASPGMYKEPMGGGY